jgi:ribulose-5-phosphate 4-epimerase/fuculose-1-phosphate aldolase
VRDGLTNAFYITGSGTGALATLTLQRYARVTAYDFAANWLRCEGATVASSESLTHAAVYETMPTTRVVLHCHCAKIWKQLLNVAPTTSPQVDYGTPAMAAEVKRLLGARDPAAEKIFVMAGHENGIVAFGADLAEAAGALGIR